MAKSGLDTKIIEEIQARRLTQSQAASILGIDQPKVSASSRDTYPVSRSSA